MIGAARQWWRDRLVMKNRVGVKVLQGASVERKKGK